MLYKGVMGHYIENYFFRLHIHNVPNVRRTCLKKNGMELNEMSCWVMNRQGVQKMNSLKWLCGATPQTKTYTESRGQK